MSNINFALIIIVLSLVFISCKNYVTNVDPLVNAAEDSRLNNESQIPFLIRGVETRFSYAVGRTDVLAADLSDAFFFDNSIPGASYFTLEDIDAGDIQLSNESVGIAYNAVGQLRFYSDDLVRRTSLISFSDTTVSNNALFTGYFYGGYARYLYAAFFGLNPAQGGSPIDNGPFIGSNEMYDSAIEKFKESLKYLNDSLMTRIVNSVIARAYLYKGDYTNTAGYASKGLINGDAPFQALNNTAEYNNWSWIAGELRPQIFAALRFKYFIDSDPNEANRIKLDSIASVEEVKLDTTVIEDTTIYYFQAVYSNFDSPQKIITWQENYLIMAELIRRGLSSGNASALELINEVRASHGIAPLSSVDLDAIYIERDKELFASGNRLVDERRFNKWHLGLGTWEYLPITEAERNGNPNIN